jgi:hypothetical protein
MTWGHFGVNSSTRCRATVEETATRFTFSPPLPAPEIHRQGGELVSPAQARHPDTREGSSLRSETVVSISPLPFAARKEVASYRYSDPGIRAHGKGLPGSERPRSGALQSVACTCWFGFHPVLTQVNTV